MKIEISLLSTALAICAALPVAAQTNDSVPATGPSIQQHTDNQQDHHQDALPMGPMVGN